MNSYTTFYSFIFSFIYCILIINPLYMGSCTPEPKASLCQRQSCRPPERITQSQRSFKTLPCQIILQPLEISKRPVRKKEEIASTRQTLRKAPTIVEAIDEYIHENGSLHHLEVKVQKGLKQTDSFLVEEDPGPIPAVGKRRGSLKQQKNYSSSFERRQQNKKGIYLQDKAKQRRERRWSPQGRYNSPQVYIQI